MSRIQKPHDCPVIEFIHSQRNAIERVDHRLDQAGWGIAAAKVVMGGEPSATTILLPTPFD
jgi:hypothetical protein